MESWRRDGMHFLLGFALAFAFLGTVVAIGGLLVLLLSVIAPASIRQMMQPFTQTLQGVLFAIAVLDTIAWNILPTIGFIRPKLSRRLAVVTAGISLFLVISLLFSL